MSEKIPEKYLDLFDKRAFAHLATCMPDGTVQVNPVWVDFDGANILVNTSHGRQKDRNMQRCPTVTVEIQDPDNPYRYLEVRGRVTAATEEGALAHIDKMARKYTGAQKYASLAPGEVRVIYTITPERVLTH
jgi:PPOX class probable F420-dependent enzyme